MTLSHMEPPESCKAFYLQGQGLPYYDELNVARREYRRKMRKRKVLHSKSGARRADYTRAIRR